MLPAGAALVTQAEDGARTVRRKRPCGARPTSASETTRKPVSQKQLIDREGQPLMLRHALNWEQHLTGAAS